MKNKIPNYNGTLSIVESKNKTDNYICFFVFVTMYLKREYYAEMVKYVLAVLRKRSRLHLSTI